MQINYAGLVPKDVSALEKVLDMCAEEQMPVVLDYVKPSWFSLGPT